MRAALFLLAAGLTYLVADTRAEDPPKGWTFTGRTQSASDDVQARVTGHLNRIAVREGDAVRKGDLLAEIDPRAYQLDVDAARSRQKVAEAKLQGAKVRAVSAKKLAEDKVVGEGDSAQNTAAKAEAEAVVLGAKAEVGKAELNLLWTKVTAPFDGRVSRIQAAEGSLVTADKTSIVRVVACGPLHVTFDVPEATVLRLRRDGLSEPGKLGVAVGFALDEGYPHTAKLDLIEPEADPKTGAVRFRATVPNPKGLLSPGMSARVRLIPAKQGK